MGQVKQMQMEDAEIERAYEEITDGEENPGDWEEPAIKALVLIFGTSRERIVTSLRRSGYFSTSEQETRTCQQ